MSSLAEMRGYSVLNVRTGVYDPPLFTHDEDRAKILFANLLSSIAQNPSEAIRLTATDYVVVFHCIFERDTGSVHNLIDIESSFEPTRWTIDDLSRFMEENSDVDYDKE